MAMHKGMCGRKDNPPGSARQDKTLADYLERKGVFKQVPENQDHMFPKKKLTFEEWWDKHCAGGWWKNGVDESPLREQAEEIWKTAQENV